MATYSELRLNRLYPHPAIVPAVDASLEADVPGLYQQFSDEILLVLQEAQPAHVVRDEKDKRKYYFFAGWQLFHELRRRGVETIYAVIHTLPPPDIKERAVMMELGISALARINKQSQAGAYQLLCVHKPLWPRIFSGDRPQTPATALERLCGISRSAAQRVCTPAKIQSAPSRLEKMLAKEGGSPVCQDSCHPQIH